MKRFLCTVFILFLAAGLASASMADTADPYSGIEIANGEAALYYMAAFDHACEKFAAGLTPDERYAALDVYDAIGQLHFDESDAPLRRHLRSINSADDLKMLLTGFFDVHDFTYHEDTATLERIETILSAARLDIHDYRLTVVRNRHDLPLIDQGVPSWYCKLGRETGEEQYPYEEIVIVLCDDDQHIFAMRMNHLFFVQ